MSQAERDQLERATLKTLVIGWQEVSKILSGAECIPIIREALKSLALGEVVLPLRQGLVQPDKKGILGMMPAYLHNPRVLGLKAISVFPGNRDTPLSRTRARCCSLTQSTAGC